MVSILGSSYWSKAQHFIFPQCDQALLEMQIRVIVLRDLGQQTEPARSTKNRFINGRVMASSLIFGLGGLQQPPYCFGVYNTDLFSPKKRRHSRSPKLLLFWLQRYLMTVDDKGLSGFESKHPQVDVDGDISSTLPYYVMLEHKTISGYFKFSTPFQAI